jgi:hypothetical protein
MTDEEILDYREDDERGVFETEQAKKHTVTVSTTRFLVTVSNSGDSSVSALMPLRACYRLASEQNLVPSWRPFHTILLVFSSQPDIQLS